MSKSLSNMSGVATEVTNTVGVMTPVLEIEPEDGTALILRNGVERGEQAAGIPIYMDLQDADGNPLPADTKVCLQFEEPADDDRGTVSKVRDNIRPYQSLNIQEQQNTDFVDRVKHVLKGAGLVIEDVDTAYLSIESSTEIDWTNSMVQFDESAVAER